MNAQSIFGGDARLSPFAAARPRAAMQNSPLPAGSSPNMSAYRPSNTAFADSWNARRPADVPGVRFTPARSVVGTGPGNLAYAPANQRPQGLEMRAYDLQGNQTSLQGQQNQRDAFIAQLMQAPRNTPSYDFRGMLQNANGMVRDGWTNPFTSMISGNAPSSGRQQAVRAPFAPSGGQAPPGFMDQLLGLLGQQAPPQQLGPQLGMQPQPQFDIAAPSGQGDWQIPPASPRTSPASNTNGQFFGLNRPVGQRFAVIGGDMVIDEAGMGTEAFEQMLSRPRGALPTPEPRTGGPGFPAPDRPDPRTGGPFVADVDREARVPPAPQTPGTATPVPPTPTGDTYPSPTPSLPPTPVSTQRPTPLPTSPPTVSPEDQAKAKREAELRTAQQLRDDVRRSRATAWAANNPNNWFMNPYMQDDPTFRMVRQRNPPVNNSGKGGGGSSPSKQINFKGPPTRKRR